MAASVATAIVASPFVFYRFISGLYPIQEMALKRDGFVVFLLIYI